MTAHPIDPDRQRMPVSVAVALVLVAVCVMAVLLVASVDALVTTNELHPNIFEPRQTLTPNSQGILTLSAGPTISIIDSRVIIENFTAHLEYLNNEMNWNLSSEQLSIFSVDMRNGVFKKFIYNPQYPEALDIPNKRKFYFEIGNSLGLTQEETARMIQKEEKNYQQNYVNSNRPALDTSITPNIKKPNITHVETTWIPTQKSPINSELGLMAFGFVGIILALKK